MTVEVLLNCGHGAALVAGTFFSHKSQIDPQYICQTSYELVKPHTNLSNLIEIRNILKLLRTS